MIQKMTTMVIEKDELMSELRRRFNMRDLGAVEFLLAIREDNVARG